MQQPNFTQPNNIITPHIHWSHFSIVMGATVLLFAATWFSKPEMFHRAAQVSANSDAPHYYAYVAPADDQPQPAVLGANTNEGPSIINEDGSVSPVDNSGQVLGINTNDPAISLNNLVLKTVPDSTAAIQKYLSDDSSIEKGPLEDSDFEAALSSSDPTLITKEISKLTPIRDALKNLSVPAGLQDLAKIKVIEYNTAIALLQDYNQMDTNPQLVGQDLENYLQVGQQLAEAITTTAQKYNLDPNAIGPAGSTSILAGMAQGASTAAEQASAVLAQQASSTPGSLGQ